MLFYQTRSQYIVLTFKRKIISLRMKYCWGISTGAIVKYVKWIPLVLRDFAYCVCLNLHLAEWATGKVGKRSAKQKWIGSQRNNRGNSRSYRSRISSLFSDDVPILALESGRPPWLITRLGLSFACFSLSWMATRLRFSRLPYRLSVTLPRVCTPGGSRNVE